MILDSKQLHYSDVQFGDLYIGLPFGYDDRYKVEGGPLLITNFCPASSPCDIHVAPNEAILINNIRFSSGSNIRATYYSREGSWETITDTDKIKEIIRDFKLQEIGI